MEAEKIEILDAEVIESNPLPLVHWSEAGLLIGGFLVGYVIGKVVNKKRVIKKKKGAK